MIYEMFRKLEAGGGFHTTYKYQFNEPNNVTLKYDSKSMGGSQKHKLTGEFIHKTPNYGILKIDHLNGEELCKDDEPDIINCIYYNIYFVNNERTAESFYIPEWIGAAHCPTFNRTFDLAIHLVPGCFCMSLDDGMDEIFRLFDGCQMERLVNSSNNK